MDDGLYDLLAIAWYQKRRYRPVECEELSDRPDLPGAQRSNDQALVL